MRFYHGTYESFLRYSSSGGKSDEKDMLFASQSIGIANRYGKNVFSVEVTRKLSELPRITVMDWLTMEPIPDGTFIIEPDKSNDDFSAPTLVVRCAEDVRIGDKPVLVSETPYFF